MIHSNQKLAKLKFAVALLGTLGLHKMGGKGWVAYCQENIPEWDIVVGWLLEFYFLATAKVISGPVPNCDRAHLCDLIVLLHGI